jgi:hypothetical protein
MKTQITFKKNRNGIGTLAVLLMCLVFGLNSFGQNITQTLIETWDASSNDWQNSNRQENTYDSNGYLKKSVSQNWDIASSTWVNDTQSDYTNNPNGTVNQVVTQIWNKSTTAWNDSQRISFTYTPSDKLLMFVFETSTGTVWNYLLRSTNTYNPSDKLLTTVTETFASDWQNSSKLSNTYDSNGYVINNLSQNWDIPTSEWKNIFQSNHVNNPNGLVNQTTSQFWNVANWNNSQRHTYTYNNSDKLLTTVTETWDFFTPPPVDWRNSNKEINTYDGNGYLINSLSQTWDIPSSIWNDESQDIYTNKTDGTATQIITQLWDGTQWDNFQKITFTYGTLGINEFINEKNFVAYPNPAHDIITIRTNDNILGSTYFITDQTGRQILTGELNQEETAVDVNKLVSGVYFFQIGQNKTHTFKMIKN